LDAEAATASRAKYTAEVAAAAEGSSEQVDAKIGLEVSNAMCAALGL
jgi:hypothetical protein